MRKIILVSLWCFVGNSFLVGSQICVTNTKQDKVANSVEKTETDKWVQYSLSNQFQEESVYKIFRETGKTASFIINAVDPETLCRVILMKFKDNAFVSLQKAYEQQEKIAASSC